MIDVDVLGVRVEMPTNNPIVLLKERDGDRYLPVWIGAAEAAAIAYAQQGVVPPRPLTHDLVVQIVAALGHELEEVRIVEMRAQIFYATLRFSGGVEVGSRTSDAVALALRVDAPIRVAEAVMEEAGVLVDSDDEDEEVEKFREFLDQVSAEDFLGEDVGQDRGEGEEGESGGRRPGGEKG